MQKSYLFLFIAITTCSISFAQIDTLSKKDKASLDSMMENDEFLKLMKEESKSSVDVSIGIGNGAFSAHNNAANATGVVNQTIFTPAVLYHTKTGFSFGITGFLTTDSTNKIELYQTGLSGGYDYYGKEVSAGISFTRYLSDKKKYNTKALYQNDIYGYIKRVKGIMQPGLSLGYANGNYKEVGYTSFILRRPLRGDTLISGFDSTDNKVSYFSASVSMEHQFSFLQNYFSNNDELSFIPALIVNMGSDKNTQIHTNKIFDRIRKLNTIKKVESNNKFQLQSIASSFDFTYGIGKFFLQPNIYLDYYLPKTTAKRFTAIFSVTTGFLFLIKVVLNEA